MMNSTGLYPARSYSALGPAACCTHRPKGRGGLLAGGPAHDQCGLASAWCALWAVTLPRADTAARLPLTSRGPEARGGLRLKHQWGGRDPLGMDMGVGANRGGVALVGRRARVAMAALEATVELRQETAA
jgi:hypothetical protein